MQPRSGGPISVLLADDEQLALDELNYLLKEYPGIEVAGAASNGLDAVKMIEDLEPDVVFLDVQMPGLDGMGVIRRVREESEHQPYFVLATAYDQYAVDAFQLEAMDYLLKPVEKDRLAKTIARAEEWLSGRIPAPAGEDSASGRAQALRSKIMVKTQGRNFVVDAQDMIYATIDDGLITIVTSSLEGSSNYRTIEELQSNLDPATFWRVHRSFLVNINRIKEVIPWFKSSFQLRMDDKKQTEVPVSRVQTKRLRALLKL